MKFKVSVEQQNGFSVVRDFCGHGVSNVFRLAA